MLSLDTDYTDLYAKLTYRLCRLTIELYSKMIQLLLHVGTD